MVYTPNEYIYSQAINNYATTSFNDRIGHFEIRGVPVYRMQEYRINNRDLIEISSETVESVSSYQEGENDGEAWVIYGRFRNGDYFHFNASCDYTGFDCQGGGVLTISPSWEMLENNINFVQNHLDI